MEHSLSEIIQAGIMPQQKAPRKNVPPELIDRARVLLLTNWFPSIGFDPSEFESAELDKLAAWVCAYWNHKCFPDKYDKPSKCMLLCGPCGRGKTMIAKLISRRLLLPFFDADDLSKMVNDPDSVSAYSRERVYMAKYDFVLDDLGAETLRTHYGNDSEFPQLLQRLYEQWNYKNKLIFATTNLSFTPEGLREFTNRYGERITDRLVDMFTTVRLAGATNWRRVQPR